MIVVLLRRLGVFALTAAVASVVTFLLLATLPGDAARVALGVTATPAQVAAQRAALGLDRPLAVQYADWAGHFLVGNLGISSVTRAPIGPDVADAAGVTAWLVGAAMALALAVALPLGTLAAVRARRADGVLLSALSQVGVAVPGFLAGLLLVTVFAVLVPWLPSSGWVAPDLGVGQFLRHLVLPAAALGSVQGAILTRYVRSAVLEVVREDFVRTARAKGLRPVRALVRHGLRNAAVPVVVVAGVQLSALLVGAVVIEKVFVVPGLGSLLLQRVAVRDLTSVQGIVMVLVLAILVINLLVDLAQLLIDPRLRRTS